MSADSTGRSSDDRWERLQELFSRAVDLSGPERKAFVERETAGDTELRYSMAERRDRFIRAVMASAAIPLAFDPIFIDGCMHVDGGARQHLFVGEKSPQPSPKRPGSS